MLPRSDKFYVSLIVGFAAVLIVASIIAAVSAFSGDSKSNPAYESAPDPSLIEMPPETLLINPDNAVKVQQQISSPPIDDALYLRIHRTMRQILDQITNKGFEQEIRKLNLGYETERQISSQQKQSMQYIGGLTVKAKPNTRQIDIARGGMKMEKTGPVDRRLVIEANGNQDFVGIGPDGTAVTNSVTVNVDLLWALDLHYTPERGYQPVGQWRIIPGESRVTLPPFQPDNGGG